MQICTNRCKLMFYNIKAICVWRQLWLFKYRLHVTFPSLILGKLQMTSSLYSNQLTGRTVQWKRGPQWRYCVNCEWCWKANDDHCLWTQFCPCICVCNDHWPPAGGTTWSSSFMLVLFQIFLITALSSSLACSRLPWKWRWNCKLSLVQNTVTD